MRKALLIFALIAFASTAFAQPVIQRGTAGGIPVVLSPAQITSDQNNYDPGTATVLRLSTDASRAITGFTGGASGRALTIINVGSFNLVLKNQSGSSTGTNRIITKGSVGGPGTEVDATLAAGEIATMMYDATTLRWRVTSARVRLGGILCSNATSAATTGTTEEVLATCTLPANTLSTNLKAIRVTAVFAGAANGNTKVAKIRFGGIGGDQVAAVATGTSTAGYRLVGEIIRTGANAQISQGYGMAAAVLSSTIPVAMTKTDTASIDIVATGTTATAAGDLTFKYMLVEVLNQP